MQVSSQNQSQLKLARKPRSHGHLPDDKTLIKRLEEAQLSGGLAALSRELNVGRAKLKAAAERLGVSGCYIVRNKLAEAGLDDDVKMANKITTCKSMEDLARIYGLPSYHFRNQARRLKVFPGGPASPLQLPLPKVETKKDLKIRLDESNKLLELALIEADDYKRDTDALKLKISRYKLNENFINNTQQTQDIKVGPSDPLDIDGIIRETMSAGNVVILPKALRQVKKCRDINLQCIRDGLLALRDICIPYRMKLISTEKFNNQLTEIGFEETACLGNAGNLNRLGYVGTWNGKPILLDRHQKWGVAWPLMIRFYYHYDSSSKQIVVGWLPTHLKNSLTN